MNFLLFFDIFICQINQIILIEYQNAKNSFIINIYFQKEKLMNKEFQ